MKSNLAVLMFFAAYITAGPAGAAMPVIDAANLTQAINQVNAWKSQYQQMFQQIQQLQQQIKSSTGSRGLGNIVNNPQMQRAVPPEVLKIYSAVQSLQSNSGMTANARLIREASKIYDCENRSGGDLARCHGLLNSNAQLQAFGLDALKVVNQRVQQIQSLQDQIDSTNDSKSIAELQARLQAENTQVSNDASRLMLLRTLADAADRAAQQAIKEREMRSLSLTSDGSDTFIYHPKP